MPKTLVGWLTVAYVVLLHGILALLVIRSDVAIAIGERLGFSTSAARHMAYAWRVHQTIDAQLDPGAILFLGDSLTQSMAVRAVAPEGVNFGIGFLDTAGLAEQMPAYRSLGTAGAVFLAIGTNDILHGRHAGIETRLSRIVERIPPGVPLVWSAIPPQARRGAAEAAALASANDAIRALCAARPRCVHVDTTSLLGDGQGGPRPEYFVRDGVHLSVRGYRVWAQALREAGRALALRGV